MKSYFLLFIFVVFVIDAANGLECYQCEYHEDAPLEGTPIDENDPYYDQSCKTGKKPKKDLSHVCGSGEDVCAKIYVEGERNGEKIKSTIRDCATRANLAGFETDKCADKGGEELGKLIGINMPFDFKGTLCVCSGEKCNSSSMLKTTNGLIVLTIGVLTCKLLNL